MNRKHTFAIGVLAGVCLGAWLAVAAGVPRPASPASDTPAAPAPRVNSEPTAESDPQVAAAPSDVRVAVPSVTLPPTKLTLQGSVFTTDGRPLEGVECVASPVVKWPHPRRDLQEFLSETARVHTLRQKLSRVVHSDSDGHFLFERLADREYQLEFALEGYSIVHRENRASIHGSSSPGSVKPSRYVYVDAIPVGQVRVTLETGSATPPSEATLLVHDGANYFRKHRWTRETPTITCPVGSYTVSAQPASLEFSTGVADVRRGEETHVELTTFARGGIRGTVSGAAEATNLYAYYDGAPPPGEDVESWFERKYWAQVVEGRFEFAQIVPGEYVLAISRGSHGELGPTKRVTVNSGESVDCTLEAPPLRTPLTIRIRDSEGNSRADDISVTTAVGDADSYWGSPVCETTPEGEVRVFLDLRTHQRLNAGEPVTVTVTGQGFGRKARVHSIGETIEIQIEPLATLEIEVTGLPPDFPRDNLRLSIERHGGPKVLHLAKTLDGIESGAYDVRLYYSRGHDNFEVEYYRDSIHVPPGRSTLEVPAPPLYSTRLLRKPPSSRTRIARLSGIDGDEWNGWFDVEPAGYTEDAIEVHWLPAGEYLARTFEASGDQTVRFSIPADREVAWETIQYRSLRVKIDDENGPLSRAGFRDRDLIVGVNGFRFAEQEHFRVLSLHVEVEESVTLTVVREGRELELEVESDVWRRRREGSRVIPTFVDPGV